MDNDKKTNQKAVGLGHSENVKKVSKFLAFKLPFIGHLELREQMRRVFMVSGTTLAVSILSLVWYQHTAGNLSEQKTVATEMGTLAQKLGKVAALAAGGREEAFVELDTAAKNYKLSLDSLLNGGDIGGRSIKALGDRDVAEKASNRWNSVAKSVAAVLSSKSTLLGFGGEVEKMNKATIELSERAKFLGSAAAGLSERQSEALGNLRPLLERMSKNANVLLSSENQEIEATFLLGKDSIIIRVLADALLNGDSGRSIQRITNPEQRAALESFKKDFDAFAVSASFVQRNFAKLEDAKAGRRLLAKESEALTSDAATVVASVDGAQGLNLAWLVVAAASGFMFFLSLLLMGKVLANEAAEARRISDKAAEGQLQGEAILLLMKTLGVMSKGDLTQRAIVDDSLTGSVSDAVNEMAENLSGLVKKVVNAANILSNESEKTSQLATEMSLSAYSQQEALGKAGEEAAVMRAKMEEVSENAKDTAMDAEISNRLAEEGVESMTQTVQQMDGIRDSIQETSKRIKILAESSTAITEVTTIIRNTTKQISLLALNSAIQAASAGEAGRGFSVIATEIQRLAIASAENSEHIDSLVSNILNDSKEALSTMERTTTAVVGGAQKAQEAGRQIEKLGEAAKRSSENINTLADDVVQQAAVAEKIVATMANVRQKSDVTRSTVAEANNSIETMGEVGRDLVASVSEFKV